MSKIVNEVKRKVAELKKLQAKELEIQNSIRDIIEWRQHELSEQELTDVLKLTGYNDEF